MMQTVLAPTIKCGASWDPYVMAVIVLVFFIGSLSIQKRMTTKLSCLGIGKDSSQTWVAGTIVM